jgi:hypothetical protein
MAVPVSVIIAGSVAIIQEALKLMETLKAEELSEDEKDMIRIAHRNVQAETDRLLPIPDGKTIG